ncbi:LAETG motif-containing sortase-dependent surface protein [Streptomyces sp. I4(2020)]|uniref:LAETG motif-containing sortase-dependent surface protein n=1 Tax=Streptomyces sp. I4(2020) TaxID=2760981 RepID=UPI0018EE91A9|nr:LAETG motif-containing sortase-dependent surface protein [Streptomyces sp. I4(2020)]MBJ6615127.1 LPXTG cell wall anchor domain-containing protein [Streptomyces sp. I3(2020)]MBJ6625555.1 LPXTG cell wall anchor domain-containing protein [Streptomyces sp. I4(2020)]
MKLRRALAAAAATAAIVPAALLAAPAAHATDPTSTASATGSTETDTTAPTATPAQTESTESGSGGQDEQPEQDTDESGNGDEGGTGEEGNGTDDSASSSPSSSPSPSASTSPSPSPSTSSPAEEDPELCVDENGESTAGLSEDLRSGLSGLPETIVAGSGWTTFSFDVTNRGDEEIENIKPLIGVAAIGWEDVRDYSGQITVQVYDKAAGKWNTLAGAAGEGATFAAFSLGAGQSASYQLRLSVSGNVPDALGLTGGFAEYSDTEGCWVADDPNGWIYFFDILAAGSDAGDPDDAKPQTGGVKELDKVSEVKVTGSLAETGSNSALPVIGLVGGVAVVAGAGALFVVRRRKAGAEA